jgi:DUF1680 family protein
MIEGLCLTTLLALAFQDSTAPAARAERTAIAVRADAQAKSLAAGQAQPAARGPILTPVVPIRAEPFPPVAVRLLDGPFRHAQELDRAYLLSLDPDRLLHNFRANAGLPTGARPYGGWEEPKVELRGHFVGHYLTACARMYAATGDERLKARVDAIVAGLAECQAKLGSGYLSAFPESFIDRVERRQRVWAPWYTLHKILAGLLDAHAYTANARALDIARRFGDWVQSRAERLSPERIQGMLGNEHGGINEALARLAVATGDRKYLDLSLRFNHHAVLDPAAAGRDTLTGLHANTQIPKFIGNALQYELTGDLSLRAAAEFFWNTVVHERSYVIGGHSYGEVFTPKETLSRALGSNTTETCNTYNMIKLTHHLFAWAPQAEYADYVERALWNHILASQDPVSGMMCYYVPLRSGSRKVYSRPEGSFWCCTGTGVENFARVDESLYAHSPDGTTLYWNQFIASTLDWKDKGLALRQETRFPDESTSRLIFRAEKPVSLTVVVRRPAWAGPGWGVRINGEPVAESVGPGRFLPIAREWKDGDAIELTMPFALRTEGFRDNPERLAFLYGPLVLAAEIEPGRPTPAIVTGGRPLVEALVPVAGKGSTFRADELFRRHGGSDPVELTFEPFFRVHGARHYGVYWDVYSPEAWKTREAEYDAEQARVRELDSRTVDRVVPGVEQSERDHAFAGDRTGAGQFQGRPWRHAEHGWFGYNLRIESGKPQQLLVTYWGSDGGNRTFDVEVDGKVIATETLRANRPGQFFDRAYDLPEDLTRDRDRIQVRFRSGPGQTAGGVFGIRVVRRR